MRVWRPLLAVAACWRLAAADGKPKDSLHEPKGQPKNLFFFKESEVGLYWDSKEKAIYRSTNAGDSWKKVDSLKDDTYWRVIKHPHDHKTAIALDLEGFRHYITKDQGEKWTSFEVKLPPSAMPMPLSFHASEPDHIMFHGLELCGPYGCLGPTWVTTDGFKEISLLHENRRVCNWAKTEPEFTTGDSKMDKNRILCAVQGNEPWKITDHKLLISDNFFKDSEEPIMSNGRKQPGVTSLATAKKFMVMSAKAANTNELSLFSTTDTVTWHQAIFHDDHRVEEDAYTVLESTEHSIQVDVMTSSDSNMGTFFTSNSNGTYFHRNLGHTNRNEWGFVDFEKVANIEGLQLVNVVDNYEELENRRVVKASDKKLVTKMSYDGGRTWNDIKADGKTIHLHSVTEAGLERIRGKIFSTAAPGAVMGIGNTGDSLKEYKDGDLYMSHDAGRTWAFALEGPHIYATGDQGAIIVAIKNGKTNEIRYSKDFGQKWETYELSKEVEPQDLLSISGTSGFKFLLSANKPGDEKTADFYIIQLDFSDLYSDKCSDKDFEKWYARLDKDDEPTCIMGRKVWFKRRKIDANCYVKEDSDEAVPEFDKCPCTIDDFECDYNFYRDDGECKPTDAITPPEGKCKNPDDTYMGESGWRKIPGDECEHKDKLKIEEPVERKCGDVKEKPTPENGISTSINEITGTYGSHRYLERTDTSAGDDETLVLLTADNKLRLSRDHGKNWVDISPEGKEKILAIHQNPHFHDHIYFLTDGKKVYYSHDRLRGEKLTRSFEIPNDLPDGKRMPPGGPLRFNEKYPDWLIWLGDKDCPGSGCRRVSSFSAHAGESWNTMLPYVEDCQFVTINERRNATIRRPGEPKNWIDKPAKLVYCTEQDEGSDGKRTLFSSDDEFESKHPILDDVVMFATMNEFVVIARHDEKDREFLQAYVSVDGETAAHAKFPPDLPVSKQLAYTVLESSTHAVFLHMVAFGEDKKMFGHILKSDSNGTNYVLSLANVNRGFNGYIDFEKMQNLEGVAFANIVGNNEKVIDGADKKLKTKITHNDGSDWVWLEPPKGSECSKASDKCSLHLHNFNERFNPGHSHTSASAVGLMLATGNVGEWLAPKGEGDTFMTRDGGLSWQRALEGTHIWEYGDQGGIILAVQYNEPTDFVSYTLDEGKNWETHKFADEKYSIFEVTTVPSDTSFNFLLWAKPKKADAPGKLRATINLDFSDKIERACKLTVDNPGAKGDDYELWQPGHPLQDDGCLFGHKVQYARKKPGAACYNDRRIELLESRTIASNCSCTDQDFECNYNYVRAGDFSCRLVPGLDPPNPMDVCFEDEDAFEYYEGSKYRRIPMTTCKGGKELDKVGAPKPCPDKKEEFERKRGVSGFGVFLAVVLPFAIAGGVGYYVWRHWDGKFGRIRLGESPSDHGLLDGDRPWVQWPVAAVSALIAVASTIPMLVGMTWRSVSSRFGSYRGPTYRTRGSFARGRGDYTAVDADEGELLGDESDEEW